MLLGERVYPWGNTPVLSNMQDSTAAYANYNGLGDGSAPRQAARGPRHCHGGPDWLALIS